MRCDWRLTTKAAGSWLSRAVAETTAIAKSAHPGDPIETKIGRCIVTSTELMPAGSEFAGKIICHFP